MKIKEFEQKVWQVERIRIVLRAHPDTEVKDYDYKNAAIGSWSLKAFLESRIASKVGDIPIAVILGDGQEAKGQSILRNIREKYIISENMNKAYKNLKVYATAC
jgi:hypothetical protein